MGDVGLPLAFGLGILSFASPCVVPLVPVYLANIAGLAVLSDAPPDRRRILISTILFVAGFGIVFLLMGTALQVAFGTVPMPIKQKVAGGLLIGFGMLLYASTRIPRLNFSSRLGTDKAKGTGYVRSAMLGSIFAIGWTPCIGPIIGGVLAMAAYGGNALAAVPPLTAYSLGLGVPFIIMGLLLGTPTGTRALQAVTKRAHLATLLGSATLIIVGVLMFTGTV